MYLFVFDMNEGVIKVLGGEYSTHRRNGSFMCVSVRACRIVMRVIGACYRSLLLRERGLSGA